MSTLIILGLLAGSVIFLLAALGFLYRYLVRKRLFPQLPRLWMGDRKRFFVFFLIFICFCGAFFVVSAITQPRETAPEARQAQRPAPALAGKPPLGRQPAARPAAPPARELSARQSLPTTTLPPAREYRPEPAAGQAAQAPPMAEPGTRPEGRSMTASTTTTTMAAKETTTSTTATTTSSTTTSITTTTSTTTTTPTTTSTSTTTTLKAPVAEKPAAAPPAALAKVYTVCAASYRKKEPAEDHAAKLAQKGLKASVAEVHLKEKGRWFRVCVGEFKSAKEALAQSRVWRQEGLIPDPFVARMR